MDYAYVPPTGDPDYDEAAKTAEGQRPDTVALSFPGSLAEFLQAADSLSITYPVDDLLLHAHGDSEGEVFVSLDPSNLQQPVVYEDLERVKANNKINIPPHLLKPSMKFRMLSCLIGSDTCTPYLQLLKQALGNPKSVSAPRYIHAYRIVDGTDVYEFMKYFFRIANKTPLSRAEILSRFKAAANSSDAQFRFVDGTKIPDANWDQWVPPPSAVGNSSYKFDFPVTLVGYLWPQTLEGEWRFTTETYTSDPVVFLGNSPPTNESEALAQLENVLSGGIYDSSHPFPVYKRYHHDQPSEFLASWIWRANGANGKFDVVHYVGSRYVYKLEIPITKPGTNELIFNFYPHSGSPIINFTESNQPYKLFGVV